VSAERFTISRQRPVYVEREIHSRQNVVVSWKEASASCSESGRGSAASSITNVRVSPALTSNSETTPEEAVTESGVGAPNASERAGERKSAPPAARTTSW
jgi:hypothetical protein